MYIFMLQVFFFFYKCRVDRVCIFRGLYSLPKWFLSGFVMLGVSLA
jgi:hypothetical protein